MAFLFLLPVLPFVPFMVHHHHKHHHKHHDDRDVDETGMQSLLHCNTTLPSTVDFSQLRVVPSDDAGNSSATFEFGGQSVDGVMTGYPVVGLAGVMGGEFSFAIPGVDSPAQGTWISVDRSAESVDEKKAQAFDQMVQAVSLRREELSLEAILDAAAAAQQ